jgi:hypothetical protein
MVPNPLSMVMDARRLRITFHCKVESGESIPGCMPPGAGGGHPFNLLKAAPGGTRVDLAGEKL